MYSCNTPKVFLEGPICMVFQDCQNNPRYSGTLPGFIENVFENANVVCGATTCFRKNAYGLLLHLSSLHSLLSVPLTQKIRICSEVRFYSLTSYLG